jgi:hypothetical protein
VALDSNALFWYSGSRNHDGFAAMVNDGRANVLAVPSYTGVGMPVPVALSTTVMAGLTVGLELLEIVWRQEWVQLH